jgi:hypothetical protein
VEEEDHLDRHLRILTMLLTLKLKVIHHRGTEGTTTVEGIKVDIRQGMAEAVEADYVDERGKKRRKPATRMFYSLSSQRSRE